MIASTICVLFMVLSIGVEPSQELPGLISTVTGGLLKASDNVLKSPPPLLDPFNLISKVKQSGLLGGGPINTITALTEALQNSDYLLVGIKFVELTRSILKFLPIPGIGDLDRLLELIHGTLETIHPFVARIKENAQAIRVEEIASGNGDLFTEINDVTPASILSKGFEMVASFPNLLSG